MKTLYTAACVLFITLSLSINTISAQENNNTVATFKGVTEADYFKFENAEGATILFYDIDENIDIALYDDEFIGKKFSITWVLKKIEVLDEEGNPTEDLQEVNSITALKEEK
ncbi:hypothetical protein [Polaribacter sp.]|uniref:hypothetical protein n=1 Tax=Polaribacter sp. TaxID=1920175 RepID=UPI003EF754F6